MKYNIKNVKEKALILFDTISKYSPLEDLLKDRITFYEWETKTNLPNNIKYSSGATRIAFWDENEDFVYKIQYVEENKDYGSDESYVYEIAESWGVSECFAWTSWVCKIFNKDIYAMEYCDVDDERNSSDSYDYHLKMYCEEQGWNVSNLTPDQEDEINDVCYDYCDHYGMLEFASNEWTDYEYNMVTDIIEKLGIDDLHSGNWGRYNGKLVLTDYAGYTNILIRQ